MLISSNLAANEPLNNFLFCFQDHFPPSRIGPPLWKTLTVILSRSTNFEYKSLLHVNGRTHITPYVWNIGTTNALSDLQFCRYNRTPLKVASAKYEVATSNVVLLPCGCLSLNPFIEISIRNNSSSSDVLNIQASISISPKFESK